MSCSIARSIAGFATDPSGRAALPRAVVAGLAVSLVAAGCQTAGTRKSDPVPASSLEVSYEVPEFNRMDRQGYRRTSASGRSIISVLSQANRDNVSAVIYWEVFPGSILSRRSVRMDREHLKTWSFFKECSVESLQEGDAATPVGTMPFAIFESDDLYCFAFQHYWGPSLTDDKQRFTRAVDGFQCRRGGAWTAGGVADRMARLSIQGEGTPAPAVLARTPRDIMSPPPAEATRRIPFNVTWHGIGSEETGTMTATADRRTGDLRLRIGGSTCSGSWAYRSGKLGTEALPTGTWEIRCENGRTASGTYRLIGQDTGFGDGTDDLGRKLTVSFGGEAKKS